ncbi:heavy metal-associated isoprenylated plant protein 39-like [Zingiber officinale]|uniref:heavy metal-associated isoprenylated plant protein 39-like n=1 Tax=Zingiber officinale TaxID=94328 RepID=UPI001C4B7D1F|nr:heavy metal-associated isoprenylated plant protein 39-like [Zingiber officinale]
MREIVFRPTPSLIHFISNFSYIARLAFFSLSIARQDMKKIVVRVDVPDDKEKAKAMQKVSTLQGIESISVDMKDRKMTVIGDVDAIDVVGKLRKGWPTEIVTVGPKEEPKDEETKKKEEEKKKKEEEEKRKETEKMIKQILSENYCNPCMPPQHKNCYPYVPIEYCDEIAEANPNACVVM